MFSGLLLLTLRNGGMLSGLFFVTLFICLGQPLLDLWMGRALLGAWPLLVILGLGELLAMSQWITYSMILGMGRHKLTACFNMLDTDPYIWYGAYMSGCLTRISTAALLNVTAGGGSTVPTFVIEKRA